MSNHLPEDISAKLEELKELGYDYRVLRDRGDHVPRLAVYGDYTDLFQVSKIMPDLLITNKRPVPVKDSLDDTTYLEAHKYLVAHIKSNCSKVSGYYLDKDHLKKARDYVAFQCGDNGYDLYPEIINFLSEIVVFKKEHLESN